MLLCCGNYLDHIYNSNDNNRDRNKFLSFKWTKFEIESWENTDYGSSTVSNRGGFYSTTRKNRVVSFVLGKSKNMSRRLSSSSVIYFIITDLCSTLHLCTKRKCVDVLFNQYFHEYQVFVLDSREILDRPSLETVLTSWIKKSKRRRNEFQFGYRQRLFITAFLVFDILRLDESWLKKNWNSHDIYLIPSVETGPGGTVVEDELYHSYFSWKTLKT